MEGTKSKMVTGNTSEHLSLSLSSSSSSSKVEVDELPRTSAPATSPLPPRSPSATTTRQQNPEEVIEFYLDQETKIVQEKTSFTNKGNRQQQSNSMTSIQQHQDQKITPAKLTRNISWNDEKANTDDRGFFDNGVNRSAEIHDVDQNQHQKPQQNLAPAGHKRKVSWGGKLIQIPHVYNDTQMPVLLQERSKENDNDFDGINNEKNADHKAIRTKAASELVSAVEAKMKNEGVDSSMAINTKYQNHRRDESSLSAVDMNDLAKMHPIESEAAFEILKAVESQDQDRQQQNLPDEEQVEGVANLFAPTDTKLLDNVPEGAEGLFRSRSRKMSYVSSVTGNSMTTNMSETMIGSSNYRNDSLKTRGGRGRADSATQYSNSSTIEETTNNTRNGNAGHRRTNTMASIPTITTTIKSVRQQGNRTYDYSRRHHRRQETMEERLFSLNQALDAVDTSASIENSTSKRQDREQRQEQRENPSRYNHRPSTSLDLFNQNLARLFQDVGNNPDNGRGYFDQKEIVPLTNTAFGASSTKSTGTTTEEVRIKQETEVAPVDELSESAQHSRTKNSNRSSGNLRGANLVDGATANDAEKRYQEHVFPPNLDNDVERGIVHPKTSNTTTNDFVPSPVNNGRKKWSRCHRCINKTGVVHDIKFFLKSRIPSILRYLKNLFLLVLAALSLSAVLFYLLGNPPIVYDYDLEPYAGNHACRYIENSGVTTANAAQGASYSWWILFLSVRLPITLTIARSLEIFWIQFIILDCRWVGSCMSSTLTLLIVQARGWPATLFFWSICNLFMLYGTSPFVNHWGYWQNYIELFNECNASGTIIGSDMNLKVQLIALVLSVVVAVKRLLIGFYQGRKTFLHYAEELSTLMTKLLLISEVSNLAIDLEMEEQEIDDLSDSDNGSNMGDHMNHLYKRKGSRISGIDNATELLKRNIDDEEGGDIDGSRTGSSYSTIKTNMTRNKLLVSDQDDAFVTGLLSQSQKRRIERLLGSWEEPENEKIMTENVSIGAILQFRRSLKKLDSSFPFSYAFGKADTRDFCIQSSQNLYFRLLEKSPDKVFHFNILGLTALRSDGSLDQEKLKSLIKVFRPDRDGLLSLIDFVKSTDIVYKEMKLLRASVRSSQKIEKSFEKIFNVVFYFAISCIILNVLGYDPIAVFLSLSSVVLAFSFMISQASSKYVEGLLFILYRRPYDIGDCIAIQPVDEPTSLDGSTEWFVRDINLFTTTVIYAYTNEMATLSNGSIANSRVMNGARSLPAVIYVSLRFGVDTNFEKLEIFREAVSQYVDKRPREWAKLLRITNLNVQADQGYVEYMVVLQHVNNWQHLDSIQTSRSHAKFFCHELSKQLGMRYKSPPLPVDLSIEKSSESNSENNAELSIARLSAESDQIRNLVRDRRM